jgi:hypothetical protein
MGVGTQKLGHYQCPANPVMYHQYPEMRRMLVTRRMTTVFIILVEVLVLLQIVTPFANAMTNYINV